MAKKPMGQHVVDELEVLESMIEETKRRFGADLDTLAGKAAALRGDLLASRDERQRQRAVDAAAEQAASGKPAPRSNGNRALQGRPPAEEAADRALQRGGQQHRPDTDPAPGDEPPVAWPCRRPDDQEGYAVKLQDRANGAPGMQVTVRAKSGKVGTAELDAHLETDRFGEIWTTGPITWEEGR